MKKAFSIEKIFTSRRELKNLFFCVFASLREPKKEEAMPASKRGSVYESGRYLTRQDTLLARGSDEGSCRALR
jgi:hypothetical protein